MSLHPKLKDSLVLFAIGLGVGLGTIVSALIGLSVVAGIGFVAAMLCIAAGFDFLGGFVRERARENDALPYDAHFLAGETDD